jgi:predicted negative regulator of RcsB-dependent stress response
LIKTYNIFPEHYWRKKRGEKHTLIEISRLILYNSSFNFYSGAKVSEYRTDEEQAEVVKKTFKQYAPSIVIGLLLAFGLNYGISYWKKSALIKKEKSSITYQEFLVAQDNHDIKKMQKHFNTLKSDYADSPYVTLASFFMAKNAITKKDYALATKTLQSAIKQTKNEGFQAIARLRLARVQLLMKNPKAAMHTLSSITEKSYRGYAADIRGNAYLALNNPKQAMLAFKEAALSIPNAEETRPTLFMKIAQLKSQRGTQ